MATKRELARDLYQKLAAAGTLSRKQFIEEAQKPPMSMTPAGASTYYVNCKNEAEGKVPASTPRQAGSKASTSKAVDDSHVDKALYSVVVVDGLKTSNGKFVGKVDQTHSFYGEQDAIDRYKQLNAMNKARCVVVESSPETGEDLSALNVIYPPVQ